MFIVTLAVGLVVVAAVSAAPFYARSVRLPRRCGVCGAALVAAAVGLGVLSAAAVPGLPSRHLTFLFAFGLLLAGALLILAAGHDDDAGGGGAEPPWWPEFEAGFRGYVRERRPSPRPAGRH